MKQIKKSGGNKTRKKEKWNFKPWLIIGAIVTAIFAMTAILAYCEGRDEAEREVLKFTYADGQYSDSENGITYVRAPLYYQARLTTSADYPYATSNRDSLYRVGYRDADDKVHLKGGNLWLSTLLEDGAILYYNPDKVEVPDFTAFEGNEIYVCEPDGSFTTTKLEGNEAVSLLEAFFTAEGSDYDRFYTSCDLVSNLKVGSSKYNWLYLNLWLYTDAEGNYYILESETRKFLQTDADIFAPIFAESSKSDEPNGS